MYRRGGIIEGESPGTEFSSAPYASVNTSIRFSSPSDFSHTVSGYVPTVPGTVGDWENCEAQSYPPVRISYPLMQLRRSENSLWGSMANARACGWVVVTGLSIMNNR